MASTVFTDYQTRILASWLNDVNGHAYNEVATAHPASKISLTAVGGVSSVNVQGAIEELAARLDALETP